MVLAFYQYEKVKILDTKAKRWFNAVSTGLYLTLGLNLAASLKGMSIIVRWKLLARKKHQLEEVDFLLGLSSLIKVFRYGIHIAGKRPFTSLACFSWILFNAVGRLSVALTGLTYSYDSFGAVSAQDGLANVTDWTTFSEYDEFSRDLDSTPDAERYSAHSFGLFSVILKNQPLTQPGEGDPNEPLDRPIEVRSDGNWSYYFREFNPNPKNPHNNLAHKSKRFVTVSATCEYYALVEGQYGNVTTVAYLNGTQQTTLSGISDYGPSATTWINPRSDLPQNQGWNCGSRCAAVAALQFLDSNGTGNGGFYNCQVHVSKVQGGTAPEHEIPDDIAIIAAGSIGLEGYTIGPNSWEYVRYTPDSPWSNYGMSMDDATYMARIASRFAIGAIAMKDIYGLATAQAQGQIAWVGVLLKVKWPALFLILGSILICQLLMGCAVVAYSNTVFCKDDSYLSTARLLRPVVERLGPSGCAMTGKDIAHTLREYMTYGTRTVGDRHHLDLGEDIPVMPHFPQGWYDGYEEWVDDHEEIPVVAVAQKSSGRSRRKFVTNVRKRRAFGRV
ncbi:hypothetical protein BDD12DRAFT_811534 [Trichophaea hybrida]|nr:hypothetical protein BDD12DRAFT_811534 [Trichophaea hybrida]